LPAAAQDHLRGSGGAAGAGGVIGGGVAAVVAGAADVAGGEGESLTAKLRTVLAGTKLNTDQQQLEWDKNLVTFETGAGSCSHVCASHDGRVCARDWFLFIDVCSVAQKAFPNLRCSEVSQVYSSPPSVLPPLHAPHRQAPG